MAETSPTFTLAEVNDWIIRAKESITEQRVYLTELDSAIGDADHGTNLTRGFTAVVEKLAGDPPATLSAVLHTSGMTMVSSVGGASGPLYGTLFLRMAKSIGDTRHGDRLPSSRRHCEPGSRASWHAARRSSATRR